jgi:hypothetical protein
MLIWTLYVMERGPWDHKRQIQAKFTASTDPGERQWHC